MPVDHSNVSRRSSILFDVALRILPIPISAVFVLCAILLAAIPVVAKAEDKKTMPGVPDRGGFTLLLTLGVGWQANEPISDPQESTYLGVESVLGLGGLNLGIGGFVSPDVALMFRWSGTNVTFERGTLESPTTDVMSGVVGWSAQYWASDFINLEGGLGLGFANTDPGHLERGSGLILGFGVSFFHTGKNSLQVGIEYAPVITNDGSIHNVCIAFGWQLL